MRLETLGFDAWYQERTGGEHPPDCKPARVTAVHRGSYLLHGEHGTSSAELTGKYLYAASSSTDYPTVGDWVMAQFFDGGDFAVIHTLLPRKTLLKRKTPGRMDVQLLAANIDTAFIVQAVDGNAGLNRLERYLVMVNEAGCKPVLLLSKTDLMEQEDVTTLTAELRAAQPELEVRAFSNQSQDGIEHVRALLEPGKTYCLLGSSGVGKSSLLNNLLGEEAIAVGDVRAWDGKGRHTTTSRQLHSLAGGALFIDTPGMRELGNFDVEEGLVSTFDDIYELAEQCRFSDCTHVHEAGCAVLAAVEAGDMDRNHYENYIKLQRESSYYSMSELERRERSRLLGKTYKAIQKSKRKGKGL